MYAPILLWQWLFLAFLCGIYGVNEPASAGALLVLLALFWVQKQDFCSQVFATNPQVLENEKIGKSVKRGQIFSLRHASAVKKLGLLIFAFILGVIFLSISLRPVPSVDFFAKKGILQGTVVAVQPKVGGRLQCILEDISLQEQENEALSLAGRLVLTWQEPLTLPVVGQKIVVKTKVKPIHGMHNVGGWNSEEFWRQQGVFWRAFVRADKGDLQVFGQPTYLQGLRKNIYRFLLTNFPESSGRGLVLALLLGDRSGISHKLQRQIQQAGLAHSLALSGMHVGIVASFGLMLAWLVGLVYPRSYLFCPRQKLAVYFAAPLVLFYVWLGGFGYSLQRSALMFAVWGIMFLFERKNILLDGLFFSLFVICLYNPFVLFNIGLQMSALAVVGIALFFPLFQKIMQQFFPKNIVIKYLFLIFAMSVAANIVLFPLIVFHFNMFTPNLFYNILWLPLLAMVIMPLLFIGLFCIAFSSCASVFFFGCGIDLLNGFVFVLQWLSGKDWLQYIIVPRPFPEMAALWWGCVFWLFLRFGVKNARRAGKITTCFVAVTFVCSVWRVSLPYFEREMHLRVLDTGMSQAILLEFPQGKRMLVDGGGFWNADFDVGRLVVAPRLTLGRLPFVEQIVLTHDDVDHRRGLIYLLNHFGVGEFAYNGRKISGKDGEQIQNALRRRKIPAKKLSLGQKIEMSDGFQLEVLWPPREYESSDNNMSIVLRLVKNGRGLALLPGDIENPALLELLKTGQDLQADILVLPHHGSRSSLLAEFYERVRPKIALAAVGFGNHYGFPHAEVVEFCRQKGILLFTTAQSGELSVSWKAKLFYVVEGCRKSTQLFVSNAN